MWQGLLEGLGYALSTFYDLIPSVGVAIILLTVAVRVLLLPLTIKQTRSMQEMGKIQPQLKALQKKHKGDRQKLNEEMMKLYKEHKVNPLGGCLPLLLQLPIFFALFSLLRATTPAVALPVESIPMDAFGKDGAFCAPVGDPSVNGTAPSEIQCDLDGNGEFEETYSVSSWEDGDGRELATPPDIFTRCNPREGDEGTEFFCESPVGTGHIPPESQMYADVIDEGEPFLGMHLSCGATQAQSEEQVRQCAPRGTQAGGAPLVGYYGLIALMVASTWYQTRQMQSLQGTQQPGAQAIGKIMPVFLGFISLGIPAGVLVYWVTTNLWTVGQQYVMQRQKAAGEASVSWRKASEKPAKKDRQQLTGDAQPKDTSQPQGRKPGGKNARSRKKRRKR